MSSDFYLVQRLTRRNGLSEHPFDSRFGCDYMGSAEFEFGAIPEAFKRLRSLKRLGVAEGEVLRNGVVKTVYVIGDPDAVATIPERLSVWMKERYPWGKERTYFPERVDGTDDEYQRRTAAWWGLREDVMWTLDPAIFEDLKAALGYDESKRRRKVNKVKTKKGAR